MIDSWHFPSSRSPCQFQRVEELQDNQEMWEREAVLSLQIWLYQREVERRARLSITEVLQLRELGRPQLKGEKGISIFVPLAYLHSARHVMDFFGLQLQLQLIHLGHHRIFFFWFSLQFSSVRIYKTHFLGVYFSPIWLLHYTPIAEKKMYSHVVRA